VQEQPQLVGCGLRARGAVCRQMRLPGLNVILGLAAPAVEVLVESARIAGVEIGDDEARVGPLRAGFDAGDDPRYRLPEQGRDLRSPVQGLGGGEPKHRGFGSRLIKMGLLGGDTQLRFASVA
jgi:hypothetical protein